MARILSEYQEEDWEDEGGALTEEPDLLCPRCQEFIDSDYGICPFCEYDLLYDE